MSHENDFLLQCYKHKLTCTKNNVKMMRPIETNILTNMMRSIETNILTNMMKLIKTNILTYRGHRLILKSGKMNTYGPFNYDIIISV